MTPAQTKAWAAQIVAWEFDRLRLELGLVEVVPREPDEDLTARRLRRSGWPQEQVRDPRPCRFLPTHRDEHGQGWGVLIRDKEA